MVTIEQINSTPGLNKLAHFRAEMRMIDSAYSKDERMSVEFQFDLGQMFLSTNGIRSLLDLRDLDVFSIQ